MNKRKLPAYLSRSPSAPTALSPSYWIPTRWQFYIAHEAKGNCEGRVVGYSEQSKYKVLI